MKRFAVVTIELPLDGGDIGDAKVLAEAVAQRGISRTIDELGRDGFRPMGQVVDVRLEDRSPGAMGHAQARAFLSIVDGETLE